MGDVHMTLSRLLSEEEQRTMLVQSPDLHVGEGNRHTVDLWRGHPRSAAKRSTNVPNPSTGAAQAFHLTFWEEFFNLIVEPV
jgi:hypothetical protein